MIETIKLQRFTAFEDLQIAFSPGINLFIGENATGKTHIMKAVYAACDITKSQSGFAEKINNVFFPSGKKIGRLVKRASGSSTGFLEISRLFEESRRISIRISLSNHTKKPEKTKISGSPKLWSEKPIEAAYIPVKDMMANAPGFRSLYEERELHFEEIYVDIIRKAFLPLLKGPTDRQRKALLKILQHAMAGKVIQKNEEFFLKSKRGELEFTLLAEGYRKMGLLWLLIQNGTLLHGSVLLWDEPETNLNPRLMEKVVDILIKLQRMGVQIFIATHDYVFLKEFDLQIQERDRILFHSLYRNEQTREIEVSSTDQYLNISPNAIDDTFGSLVDREIKKSMGGLGT
jgi:predicted ATP-dependent endonuclease of OLD family